MQKLLALLSAIVLIPISVAAQTPDNDEIFGQISSPASTYYYPNLMMQYESGKPLGDDQLRYLYYGFAFQPQYKPLASNPAAERVLEIMARIAIDSPVVSDLDELIGSCTEAMQQDPFSPHLLNIMAYAYGALGDKEREKLYYDRTNAVLRVIEASGNGEKERSPMHILMFSHASDYIAAKGWNFGKSRIISRHVEYVPFDVAHNKLKGYYFDYSRIYWNKPDGYTFRRERTWQFNNLKPREYK